MEHSVEYTLKDGTSYRLTWDTEDKGGQMHYLLHENGVLKVETWHHAIPTEADDKYMRSAIIPGTFFNCVSRHLQAKAQRAQVEADMEDNPIKQLALMVLRPHMSLNLEQEEYFASVQERGHDVELLLKVMQDAEVEAFADRLNAEPGVVIEVGSAEEKAVELGRVSTFFALYWPAILWSVVVVAVVLGYMLVV